MVTRRGSGDVALRRDESGCLDRGYMVGPARERAVLRHLCWNRHPLVSVEYALTGEIRPRFLESQIFKAGFSCRPICKEQCGSSNLPVGSLGHQRASAVPSAEE